MIIGAPVGRNGPNVIFDPEALKRALKQKSDKVIDDAAPGIKEAANELAVQGLEHVAGRVRDMTKEKAAERMPRLAMPIVNRSVDASHDYSVNKEKEKMPEAVNKSVDSSVNVSKKVINKGIDRSVDMADVSVRIFAKE